MDYNIMILIKRLWKYRRTVLVLITAGFISGILIALCIRKKYDVVTRIMPEAISQQLSLGNFSLSSLSSLVNLQNTTDAIYPDVYPEVIHSYPFLAELMSMKVSFINGRDSVHTNLYDYKLNYEKKRFFYWHSKDTVPSFFNATRMSRREDRILRRIRRDIKVSIDKKTSLITLKVTSRNPQIAFDLSNGIIKELEKYIHDYYRSKSLIDLEYMQYIKEQARDDYYEAQSRYAAVMDSNQGLSRQSSRLQQQRLRSEMELASQLYEQISKREQTARIKVQENKPVLAVIQPAVLPYKGHPSRMKTVLIITVLSFVLSSVWVMFFKDELA